MADGQGSNERVQLFCRDSPQLVPIASINPRRHSSMPDLARELILNRAFRGIKLYPTFHHQSLPLSAPSLSLIMGENMARLLAGA
jgi:hypothetical protein